jgi:hypothetical protein
VGQDSGYKNIFRQRVEEKTGGQCWYCGCIPDLYKGCIEHQTPVSRGGTYDLENLVFSCISCNSRKSTKTLDEYRFSLSLKLSETGDIFAYYLSLKRSLVLCPSNAHSHHIQRLIKSVEKYAASQPVVFWGERDECDRFTEVAS